MSNIANIIKNSKWCTVRINQSVIRESFSEFIERKTGIGDAKYSFSKMDVESDDLVVTFEDKTLEKMFFDGDSESFIGVEDGDSGRLLVAQAIAEELELNYTDISVYVSVNDCSYIEVDLRTDLLERVDDVSSITEVSNNQECYLLQSCNQHKEWSSAKVVGIYTDLDILLNAVADMFMNDEITYLGRDVVEIEDSIVADSNNDSLSEEELKKLVEEKIADVLNDIKNCSSVYEISTSIDFAMVSTYTLNT